MKMKKAINLFKVLMPIFTIAANVYKFYKDNEDEIKSLFKNKTKTLDTPEAEKKK